MNEPVKPWPPVKISEKYSRKFDYQDLLSKRYVPDPDNTEQEDGEEWEEFSYHTKICTLADLLKKLPAGADPADVELYLDRSRYMDYVDFVVSIKKKVDPSQLDELYNLDYANYQAALSKYNSDVVQYREWLLKQEIAKKEEELAVLRKKITSQ